MIRQRATFALLACLLATPAAATDTSVNDLIGGDTTPTSTSDKSNPAPATTTPAVTTPSNPTAVDSGQALGEHADAIKHVQLLAGRPLPGDTCRKVIFDARPSLNKRHQLVSGKSVSLKMKELCLVGFRNDSDKRTLVVRLGEAFATLAIVLDPKLFTGYAIAPGQQITVPLRQLPVPELDVSIEVAWEEDLTKPSPRISSANLSLKRDG